MTPKERYNAAHKYNFERTYPQAWKDGHYAPPPYPKVNTANGLTKYICNFLMWHEHRATRINSTGRLIDGLEKQPSGAILTTKKWIPGSTRKGTADISATIRGRSVMIEIKIGKDFQKPKQKDYQAQVEKAGGQYWIVKSFDDFFNQYQKFIQTI